MPADRAYWTTERILLAAARGFLRAHAEIEIVDEVVRAIERFGATVGAGPDGAPGPDLVTISLGLREPLVAAADPEVAGPLAASLPDLVADARIALARVRRASHLVDTASIDGLTGLLNRTATMRQLQHLHEGDLVMMLDLDDFKAVNDAHGHDAGDAVLRTFGAVVRRGIRATDVAGRVGGDEFAVLLPGADASEVDEIVERIREEWVRRRPQLISYSGGIACVTVGPPSEALQRADRALYDAKRAGRNRVVMAA